MLTQISEAIAQIQHVGATIRQQRVRLTPSGSAPSAGHAASLNALKRMLIGAASVTVAASSHSSHDSSRGTASSARVETNRTLEQQHAGLN